MDSFSVPSVSEQACDNSINNKLLFPKKPVRQPNPAIYRKLRRGSAAARIREKQIEYPTNKELLRTIVYLRNATAVFYEPGKILPYNKDYPNDKDDEEGIMKNDEDYNSLPHHEKGKQDLGPSVESSQKCSKILTKKQKKKSNHIEKENRECGVSFSSSHVVNIKDTYQTSDHVQVLTKELHKNAFTCKTFILFCSTEIVCPQEHRAALAVKLYGVQAALLSALGNPFDMLSKSISSNNNPLIVLLNLGQASTRFLPAMIWTGMFMLSFVYTIMVVWSLPFRVPIISMLCLAVLYSLTVLVSTASGFYIICGTFRMHGILFASLGVLGFVLLLVVVVLLALFASWRCMKREGEAKLCTKREEGEAK